MKLKPDWLEGDVVAVISLIIGAVRCFLFSLILFELKGADGLGASTVASLLHVLSRNKSTLTFMFVTKAALPVVCIEATAHVYYLIC